MKLGFKGSYIVPFTALIFRKMPQLDSIHIERKCIGKFFYPNCLIFSIKHFWIWSQKIGQFFIRRLYCESKLRYLEVSVRSIKNLKRDTEYQHKKKRSCTNWARDMELLILSLFDFDTLAVRCLETSHEGEYFSHEVEFFSIDSVCLES